MKFNEYQALAFRTCKQMPDHAQNCAHMAFGLCTEAFELTMVDNDDDNFQEKAIKELGDIVWYLSGLCTFEDYDFSRGHDFVKLTPGTAITYIASAYKAFWAHEKPIDRERVQEAIYNLIFELDEMATNLERTLSQVMFVNIAKLKARYPDEYSDHLSQNKDETQE